MIFSRFHAATNQWFGAFALDDLAHLYASGQLDPTEALLLHGDGRICSVALLVAAVPAPFDSAVTSMHSAPRPNAVPWGSILLGAAAVAAMYCVYKKLTEDPEPKRIREIAEKFEREGARVSADLRGWPKPPLLNGRIPDVFAEHSDGWREAVEIENDRSIHRSHARGQIADLKRWAARTRRTSFSVEIVRNGRGGKAA